MREFEAVFRTGFDLEEDEDDSEEGLQDMARGVMIDLLSQGPKFEIEIREVVATQAVAFETRKASELLADYDAGCRGVADIDMRGILHEIIEDVRDTYRKAITRLYNHEHRIDTSEDVSENVEEFVGRIETEVSDYIVNHYGDD